MRIAFLLGGFKSGGIGRVTSILANAFCELDGFEVHTISYTKNQDETYQLNDCIFKHSLFSKPISMIKAIFMKGAVKKLKTIIINEKIDILICCGAIFFPLGILSCLKKHIECYCWDHNSPYIHSDYKFQNFCRSFAIKHCDKYITLTNDSEAFYKNKFPHHFSKVYQIYNPIDENCKKSNKYDIASSKIISVGRLTYLKNFDRLIKIADEILPFYPNWSWDIYGDGELMDELSAQIYLCKAKNQIHLKGHNKDIYSLYKNYSFLVMTSRSECFPMTLIEAAANRLPIISFDIKTGPNEIIDNGINGFLVNYESDKDMIDKINKLICDTELRKSMSCESYSSAVKFSLKEIINQWVKLFYGQRK